MTDNTILNPGSGGDTVRDLARQSGTVKTQVAQIDIGGPSANAEILLTAGIQLAAASVPVVLASDGVLPLPTGAAKDATVTSTNPYRGTSSYFGGASGTATIPAGARVVSLSAHAPAGSGGTVAIFGGQSVAVPANNGFSDGWSGLVGPAGGGNIVFTGTDSYYVVINQ